MRQMRWLELIKDYDCLILYHLGKTNVVIDWRIGSIEDFSTATGHGI
jgi:hypothetical protein